MSALIADTTQGQARRAGCAQRFEASNFAGPECRDLRALHRAVRPHPVGDSTFGVVVGPIGALAHLAFVVVGAGFVEVDEFRDVTMSRGVGHDPLRWASKSSGKRRRCCKHLLFLDGQEAAIAVGDLREPVVDELDAGVGAAARAMSSSAAVIAPVPSLQGGHCPHDSTHKNRENVAATSTMHAVSS